MATYGIYGSQPAPTTTAPKKATDIFSGNTAPAVAQGAQPNVSTPATGAAVTNPFAAPKPATSAFGPVAPAANPGSFEALLNNAAPVRQQNATGSQQAISDMLTPSTEPSRESEASRSAFIKAQNESLRQGAEQSALSGRLLTGQIKGDNTTLRNEALGQRRELENSLAIADGKRNDANRQAGVSAFLQQETLGQQERASNAQLAQADKSLNESARQFNTRQEFETWATKEGYKQDEIARAWQTEENTKGRASTEKIAFAGLAQEDKALAQAGSQFNKKLDFDIWAKNQDLSQADADRIWKSIENEKGRVFTSAESALDRALNESQFAETIGLSKSQFAEQIRQFDSKQDFDKWATKAGLDAQAAELVWKSNEADVSRKWETGERMSTQDHQINLTRLQGEVDNNKAAFAQALGVQTMEKQAQIDAIAAEQANSYQTLRDTRAMSHDEAMQTMKADLTAKLEQAGYAHDVAIQAAEIHARAVEGAQNREMATLEAKAELAYKYNALASEEGISREQIAARKEESLQQLSLGLQQLGLDTKKFEAEIKSQDFQDRAGMLSTMMEMAGDNQDVIDRASQGYLSLLKEKGMISEEQYAAGVQGITTPPPKSTGGTIPGGGPFGALSQAADVTKSFFRNLW